jgi:4-hydroxyphenylpyruvate dioxygenase-like putative hemolysin
MKRLWDVFSRGESRDSFLAKVDALARDFRNKHGIDPKIAQLGLAVPNVEAAVVQLEQAGAGPFFIAHGAPAQWIEHEREGHFQGKLGIGYLHGIELGVCEQGEGSDIYQKFIDPQGEIVLHHIAFVVPEVNPLVEKLTAQGVPLWVKGYIKQGPMRINFSYFDTVEETGVIVEIMSYTLFGKFHLKPPAAFYHGLGRLQKWTGRRSYSG